MPTASPSRFVRRRLRHSRSSEPTPTTPDLRFHPILKSMERKVSRTIIRLSESLQSTLLAKKHNSASKEAAPSSNHHPSQDQLDSDVHMPPSSPPAQQAHDIDESRTSPATLEAQEVPPLVEGLTHSPEVNEASPTTEEPAPAPRVQDPSTSPAMGQASLTDRYLLPEEHRSSWTYGYYWGLIGVHPFIAGSNAGNFQPPLEAPGRSLPKILRFIDSNNPFNTPWETRLHEPVSAIIQRKISATVRVDPVQIGYESDPQLQNILWVGVIKEDEGEEADSTALISNQTACEVVHELDTLLHNNGVHDFRVEMHITKTVPLSYRLKDHGTEYPCNSFSLQGIVDPLTPSCGLEIQRLLPDGTPSNAGTVGPFFRDKRYPGRLFALTCQHVLEPDNEEAFLDPPSPGSTTGTAGSDLIVPGQSTFRQVIRRLDSEESHLLGRYVEGPRGSTQPWLPHAPADVIKHKEDLARFIDGMKAAEANPRQRRIAKGFAYPSLATELGPRPDAQHKFTRDIAVIEFDEKAVQGLKLNVLDCDINGRKHYIADNIRQRCHLDDPGHAGYLSHQTPHIAHRYGDPSRSIFDQRLILTLKGMMSEEEHRQDRVVFMRGATQSDNYSFTDMNVGQASPVSSLYIKPYGYRKQWAIESKQGGTLFANEGDSGATVFDCAGRMAGMVHSGGDRRHRYTHPLAYATPMYEVVRQLRGMGFDPEFIEAND